MGQLSISVNGLAEQLDIPVGTVRRYLRKHGHLLNLTKTHKSYVLTEETIAILKQIRECYSQGLRSEEVEQRLLGSGIKRSAADNDPPSDGGHVGANLIEMLSNLQKLIVERFEQQDQILKTMAEMAAALQLDPESQRLERVNARLNEWRIERNLESQALVKWAELPQSERTVRTSLFKTEENVEKRERFVRAYVDKHFDEEMRNAYGV